MAASDDPPYDTKIAFDDSGLPKDFFARWAAARGTFLDQCNSESDVVIKEHAF